MTLDYFYGQAGELFSFYRIPKALFQESRFQNLSTDAKTLYGILLDRMSLSAKNGWLDEQGRVFIIFTIEDVKRTLCCADNKATKLLRELEEFGLMENIGGRIWFCHFWIDHESMVQLTEDCYGRFHVAYVLDRDTSPEMRREAALLAQKELADCMQEWGVSLLDALVPEWIKYASLAEAASHLMQVLNDPGHITG